MEFFFIQFFLTCITYSSSFRSYPSFQPPWSSLHFGRLSLLSPDLKQTRNAEKATFFKFYSSILDSTYNDNERIVNNKVLPDQMKFSKFFQSTVEDAKLMSKDQFLKYDEVVSMLNSGLILTDDVDDLWVSLAADSAGLDEEEGYELLCMLYDIPEVEDNTYSDDAFKSLAKGKESINFEDVCDWEDCKSLINDKIVNLEEITEVWNKCTIEANCKDMSIELFAKFNRMLDDYIGNKMQKLKEASKNQAVNKISDS